VDRCHQLCAYKVALSVASGLELRAGAVGKRARAANRSTSKRGGKVKVSEGSGETVAGNMAGEADRGMEFYSPAGAGTNGYGGDRVAGGQQAYATMFAPQLPAGGFGGTLGRSPAAAGGGAFAAQATGGGGHRGTPRQSRWDQEAPGEQK
jgi:hypothetical protein